MIDVTALPALVVVLPILLATVPLVLGFRYDRSGWPVAATACTAVFAGTVALAAEVYGGGGPVVHQLGGFPREIGIVLLADELSAMIALLVTGTALAVLVYTRVAGPRGSTFYSGYLLLVGGLLGVTMTNDVFNLFVFLEITGLATYALIASGSRAESAVAALKYLVLGTLGASIYLIGVGLLFMATGTLNMVELGAAIPQTDGGYGGRLVRAAFGFMIVGFSIKVAQWPLHAWQPDAYQHAPDGVTPLIAGLVSTVAAYALGRVLYTVFTVEFLAVVPVAGTVVVAIGSVSVVTGSALAAIQRDVGRMFAYSSVSQFGLVVAAYGLATETALVGAVVHLVGHGIMKAGLFLAVGVVALGTGARRVSGYAGLATRRPVAAAAIGVLLVSLVGIPPSVGFVGKWYIALGAVEAEVWPVAAVVLLSTLLTLAYAARLLEAMYVTRPDGPREPATGGAPVTDGGRRRGTTTRDMIGVLVLTAALSVLLGFAGGVFVEALEPFVDGVIG